MGLDVIPTGELLGSVLFNQDEFDESTVVGLTTEFRRIVAAAVTDPDRDWKTYNNAELCHNAELYPTFP